MCSYEPESISLEYIGPDSFSKQIKYDVYGSSDEHRLEYETSLVSFGYLSFRFIINTVKLDLSNRNPHFFAVETYFNLFKALIRGLRH